MSILRGTARGDILYGWDQRDEIYGLGGDDYLGGNAGDDVIYGGGEKDDIAGGDGNDRLRGEQGRDKLRGGSGNDFLEGGTENDILLGGKGKDLLIGGVGADSFNFSYTAIRDGEKSLDTITDFNPSEGDLIKLEGRAQRLWIMASMTSTGHSMYALDAGWGVFAKIFVAPESASRFSQEWHIRWVDPLMSPDFSDSFQP